MYRRRAKQKQELQGVRAEKLKGRQYGGSTKKGEGGYVPSQPPGEISPENPRTSIRRMDAVAAVAQR